jgi:hypothetical protein
MLKQGYREAGWTKAAERSDSVHNLSAAKNRCTRSGSFDNFEALPYRGAKI